jgi:redox-regulated HSP33 family molecular chaperone
VDTQRKAQEDRGARTLHVRVDPAQLDRFREVVALDHRTVSQDVRHYIDQRIAQADAELRAAA